MEPRRVSLLNLPQLHAQQRGAFLQALQGLVEESRFILGPDLDAFEKEFASWIGPGHFMVGCGNGTDAITLAAKALELPPGSEAVLPAMTFVATAEGLIHAGIKVRLADVSDGTWLLDPVATERALTSETRLLAPVHFYGQMAPMDSLREVADRHGCKILEDASQAHGARWKVQPVGHWGDVATYSFFPGKNLGCFGDGGAVTSRSKEIVDKASMLGKHGGLRKYEHNVLGYNSRLDNLQAAILRIKLEKVDGWNERRRQIAGWYREILSDVRDIQLPVESKDAKHVYHQHAIVVEPRDRLQTFLKDRGIETGVHYPLPLHRQPSLKHLAFAQERFPNAERISEHGLSLPVCPTLKEADIDYVGSSLRAFFGK